MGEDDDNRPEAASRPGHGRFLRCFGNGVEEDAVSSEPVPMEWKSEAPEAEATLISRLFFIWLQPLFSRASYLHSKGRALEQQDLVPLPNMDHGSTISDTFEECWANLSSKEDGDQENAELEVRLRKAILRVSGRRLVLAGILKFFNTALQFSFPLLLKAILTFIEKVQQGEQVKFKNGGYALAVALMVAMAAKALTENLYFQMANRAGWQAKVAVASAVYKKSLRLAAAERGGTTLGEMVNLLQIDAEKIELFMPQVNVLWDGAFQIIGYMVILYTLIGWPCFVGLAVMAVAGPVQGKIMKMLFGLNREMVKYSDARVKTTNEALQGVRCVKMYTWESSFEKVVQDSRDQELDFLKRIAYLRGFSRAYMGALPAIVAVVSFVVYAKGTGGAPEASTLFSALVAFEQLRFPLLFYPMALALLAQAKVSSGRVASFLGLREVNVDDGRYSRDDVAPQNDDAMVETNQVDSEKINGGEKTSRINNDKETSQGEIVMENVQIHWSDPTIPLPDGTADDKSVATSISETSVSEEVETPTTRYPRPVLSNVSLRISPGELCAVVGRVGSGKSSLCSAILNETVLGEGHISIKGSVAYAAQSPWILNSTLRENILFGLPMDKGRYETVLAACQLTHDLSLLDNGDLTEIGERGINLSGGQKARVSVARVAYSYADTVIFGELE
jgi:ABC-type multidrug transport system fused ATPase/permease subunit